MSRKLPIAVTAALTAATPAVAVAADLGLSIEIPRIKVAEYHKPYLAIFVERADGTAAGTLSVWYETGREAHGQRYLKELRQWWRKAGRGMTFPADGVSGATRAPGLQAISFKSDQGLLATLPPGEYALVVDASREAGGRESVRLPLSWPLRRGQRAAAAGTEELGAVRLTAR